ncbi:hypothetical protein D9613_008777 [Agrocybe pediades]|uniref:LITAF domain-containing protein n=1 Tax=Agrocybe pediades TaxID=84607 RepID=A0A8H4QSR4_9AGAR|nr:hypothetical protein D9613_008777 [Agrocybe pediades]
MQNQDNARLEDSGEHGNFVHDRSATLPDLSNPIDHWQTYTPQHSRQLTGFNDLYDVESSNNGGPQVVQSPNYSTFTTRTTGWIVNGSPGGVLGREGGANFDPVYDPGPQTVTRLSNTNRRGYGGSTLATQLMGFHPGYDDEPSANNNRSRPVRRPKHSVITTSATTSSNRAFHISQSATVPTHCDTASNNASTHPEGGGSERPELSTVCPKCGKPIIYLALQYILPALSQLFCACTMDVTNSNVDNIGNIGDQHDKEETSKTDE